METPSPPRQHAAPAPSAASSRSNGRSSAWLRAKFRVGGRDRVVGVRVEVGLRIRVRVGVGARIRARVGVRVRVAAGFRIRVSA